jgi:ankyrin repeat protein
MADTYSMMLMWRNHKAKFARYGDTIESRPGLRKLLVVLAGLALAMSGCGSEPTAGDQGNSGSTTTSAGDNGARTTEESAEKAVSPEEPESTGASREANLALISASSSGDVREVQSLLQRNADVHTRDDSGATPLIAAAYGNHVQVAERLIEAGADVNVKDETQQSAYLVSTSEVGDDPRLLELTLANGADVDSLDSYNGTGLIRAAERGYVGIVRELLTTDIRVDHVNNLGWTALLEAIILGDCGPAHTEVVRLLIGAGADVNLADSNGVTPLQHAEQRNCEDIAGSLRNAGAR